MQDRQKAQDYRALLLADTPLIDVRAPIEFEQGAMPGAINLPLMMDDERAAVGTAYQRFPNGYLCCARGGQRSHIVQRWLQETGIDCPLIEGGYKALRQTAIQATWQLAQKPILLIGATTAQRRGSGRSRASSRLLFWPHAEPPAQPGQF